MDRKFTWLLIMILLAILITACSGTTPEPALASADEGTKVPVSSPLEINSSSDAGTGDSQPISQEGPPQVEPLDSESPDQPETPAEAPGPLAEPQGVTGTDPIGGFLAAELAPLYTLAVSPTGLEQADVSAVAFSPDNTLIAAALTDSTVNVWASGTGDLLFTLAGHTAPVTDLAFSPDGSMLATSGEDSRVLIWDVETGTQVDTISTTLIGRALAVTFSPDGNQIAVGGHKCAVAQYSTWTGLLNRTFPQPGCDLRNSGTVQSWGLAYTADGAQLVTADGQNSEGGSIQVWETATYTGSEQVEYFYLGVQDLALSPDGATLATALIGSSQVTLVDVESGSEFNTLEGHQYRVNSVTFSPDGRLVASASRDGTVRLWDVSSGFLLRTLEGHTDAVNTVAFSPDGALIASGSDDGTVIVWALDVAGN